MPLTFARNDTHLFGRLSYLRHFDMLEAHEIEQSMSHFNVENSITAMPLELRQDAHAIDRDTVGALHVQQ